MAAAAVARPCGNGDGMLPVAPCLGAPSGDAEARAAAYEMAPVIAAEERARAERQRAVEVRRMAALVDGPTLRLPLIAMNISFDPNKVAPLRGLGQVHDGLTIIDRWGRLEATGEALVASDWRSARLPGPATQDGSTLKGPGWTLALAPGWRLAPAAKAGEQTLVQP